MRPIQFSLATLLALTGALCVLLAALKLIHPLGAWTSLLFFCAVLAHMAGNAIGTQLRDRAARRNGPGSARNARFRLYADKVAANDFAPDTQLRCRSSLGRNIIWVTIVAAVVGALGGAVWLRWTNRGLLATPGLLFGAAAFGLIGGLAGFLGSSFLTVLAQAVIQAQDNIKSGNRNGENVADA